MPFGFSFTSSSSNRDKNRDRDRDRRRDREKDRNKKGREKNKYSANESKPRGFYSLRDAYQYGSSIIPPAEKEYSVHTSKRPKKKRSMRKSRDKERYVANSGAPRDSVGVQHYGYGFDGYGYEAGVKRYPPTSSHPHSPKQPHLTSLPPEIQLSIFESLDPVTSTCLGLSSRKLYPLHRSTHRQKVSLYDSPSSHSSNSKSRYSAGNNRRKGGDDIPLCFKLGEWVPADYVLDPVTERFVSRERLRELSRERGGRRTRRRMVESLEGGGYERDGFEYGYGGYGSEYDHETRYEDLQPRLKRKRPLERHDIWSFGRRRT